MDVVTLIANAPSLARLRTNAHRFTRDANILPAHVLLEAHAVLITPAPLLAAIALLRPATLLVVFAPTANVLKALNAVKTEPAPLQAVRNELYK